MQILLERNSPRRSLVYRFEVSGLQISDLWSRSTGFKSFSASAQSKRALAVKTCKWDDHRNEDDHRPVEDDHRTTCTGEIDRRMDVLAAAVLTKSGEGRVKDTVNGIPGRVASVYSREISKTLPAKFSNFEWWSAPGL
jgi:hypothetical protein